MIPVIELTDALPEVEYAAGDVVIEEGTSTGAIWILLSGSVKVRRGATPISTLSVPGTVFGEISLLLGQPHGATVEATEPTRMRFAADGLRLFAEHAGFSHIVATGLAYRLDSLTVYLADLKQQYGAAPGIAMVSDVLRHLAAQPTSAAPAPRPVSARDPDPEY